jgi:hypothetical protein
VYAAVTPSAARNPLKVPLSTGSGVPTTFVAAFGIAEAVFWVMLTVPLKYVIA